MTYAEGVNGQSEPTTFGLNGCRIVFREEEEGISLKQD